MSDRTRGKSGPPKTSLADLSLLVEGLESTNGPFGCRENTTDKIIYALRHADIEFSNGDEMGAWRKKA